MVRPPGGEVVQPRGRGTTRRARWRARAVTWRRQLTVFALAARDPRVPRMARLLALMAVAYALSPIDLVPDFIPLLGLLDDLVLVPLLLWLAYRRIPRAVWAECAARAADLPAPRRRNVLAAAVIVTIWLVVLAASAAWYLRA